MSNYHKYKEYIKTWQKNNRDHLNQYYKEYYKNVMKKNMTYYCELCDVNCVVRLTYNKHVKTKKHIKKVNENNPYYNYIVECSNILNK